MRGPLHLAVLAGMVAAVCAPAQAQRARQAAVQVVSAPPGTRVIQAGDANALRSLGLAESVVAGAPSSATVSALINGSFPVPGFGFDFTHHAAVNRNLGVRALIDPVTQHQLALARQIRRETPVGFPVLLPTVVNNNTIIIMQPPPVIILQQPAAPAEERIERVRYVEREPEPAELPPPAPVAELAELVLIRNDGSVVFAVAFSAVQGRIVYVTREGIRRSFPVVELDVDATRRMNEERGTSLRLPA